MLQRLHFYMEKNITDAISMHNCTGLKEKGGKWFMFNLVSTF